MKLEDQVCSLELAKRLKELGVKQESYFYHELVGNNITTGKETWIIRRCFREDSFSFAAFTVAELGEIVPREYLPTRRTLGMEWPVSILLFGEKLESIEKTEANARAIILAHLIEKGIVKP